MKPKDRLRRARLLLVTDPRPDLVARVEAALRGGVDVVQLRDKRAPGGELLSLAVELKEICEQVGALFTVNDDVELARLSGAAGVHVGQEDALVASAREMLAPGAIVGRSVGNVNEARGAIQEGADYLGVGTVYYTPTKPDARVAGPTLLKEVARLKPPIPWFAIGGVTLETACAVVDAGAPGFAVVRAVLDAEDPEVAARKLRSYLPNHLEGYLRG